MNMYQSMKTTPANVQTANGFLLPLRIHPPYAIVSRLFLLSKDYIRSNIITTTYMHHELVYNTDSAIDHELYIRRVARI